MYLIRFKSNIIIYTTVYGLAKIETTFDGDTVWLSIDQMAELFQRDKSTISKHIKNVFSEGELVRESVVAYFATVQNEGNRLVETSIERSYKEKVTALFFFRFDFK